jgi:hypothetical protein
MIVANEKPLQGYSEKLLSLPCKYKIVLYLYCFENYSVKEISTLTLYGQVEWGGSKRTVVVSTKNEAV